MHARSDRFCCVSAPDLQHATLASTHSGSNNSCLSRSRACLHTASMICAADSLPLLRIQTPACMYDKAPFHLHLAVCQPSSRENTCLCDSLEQHLSWVLSSSCLGALSSCSACHRLSAQRGLIEPEGYPTQPKLPCKHGTGRIHWLACKP